MSIDWGGPQGVVVTKDGIAYMLRFMAKHAR
jgi:hypothetical protein